METSAHYRQLIRNLLTQHASIPFSYGNLQSVTVFDAEADHYLLMVTGWEDDAHIHDCLVHVDIINGKFWVQYDGSEYGIARKLAEAGVPKADIVLGYKSPELRRYTEFAAA